MTFRKAITSFCTLIPLLTFFASSSFAGVREWSNEYDDDSAMSTALNESPDLIDNIENAQSSFQTWDDFMRRLPGVTWGLSWLGVSPYGRNDDLPIIPASTLKIITSTTALRVLKGGPEFRFANSFQGKIDFSTNTLNEPEFVLSGDPTWGHGAFEPKDTNAPNETKDGDLFFRINKIVAELNKQKIKKIAGEIKISHTRPELANHSRPAEWKPSWQDDCSYTLPSPVMIDGNCASFKINSPTSASWVTPGVVTPIELHLRKGTNKNSMNYSSVLDEFGRVKKYVVSGTFKSPILVDRVPVHNNEEWLKNLLIIAVKKAGIEYTKTPSLMNGLFTSLGTFYVDLSSKPLREILPEFLRESINLIGDRLFLEIKYTLGSVRPEFGEIQSLTQIAREPTLMTDDKLKIYDGSGLINLNRVAPKLLRLYLANLQTETYFTDFFNGLAIAGVSKKDGGGTISSENANRRVLTNVATKGKIFAKTGSINEVSNLAGYFKKPDESLEPFVIFSMPKGGTGNIDSIVVEFAKQNAGIHSSYALAAKPFIKIKRKKTIRVIQ